VKGPLASLHEFADALTRAEVDVTDLVMDEKGTICSPDVAQASLAPALLTLTGTGSASAEIVVKGTMSQGGQGKILLAEQTSIGRDVAVKIVKGGQGGTLAQAELVVEARVAGQLEHPNIVPIHMLGLSADGKPILVMKRIEGTSWRDLLREGRERARDLEILQHVCRAVHFAHARGVLHRDIKPGNVMVGSFGEVYLVDWGIAVGIGEHAMPDLPHARDVRTVSGTPAYMAPEMALPGSGVELDARTDVYLLGAVLFELLTGKPPHDKKEIREALRAAHTSASSPFPDDAPEELQRICRKAMARDPADRFASAEELRLALVAYEKKSAADAAASKIAEMAWREVRAERLDAARLLVSELKSPSVELVDALASLQHKRDDEAKKHEELERFAHDQDRRVAEADRALFVFFSSVGWLLMLVGLDVLARLDIYRAGAGSFALFMAVFAAVIAVVGALVPRLRGTTASRRELIIMLGCVASLAVVHGVGWWNDIPRAGDDRHRPRAARRHVGDPRRRRPAPVDAHRRLRAHHPDRARRAAARVHHERRGLVRRALDRRVAVALRRARLSSRVTPWSRTGRRTSRPRWRRACRSRCPRCASPTRAARAARAPRSPGTVPRPP
jgi:hypothetical protein